jgi:polyhydroxyalkanoate synthesis regulator phasin
MAQTKNVVRKLIDSGMQFTGESQAKAEKLIDKLVKSGEVRRKDASETLQALAARGKQTTEHVLALVQAEVAKQLGQFTSRMDDVEDRLEDFAEQLGLKSRTKVSATVKAPTASEAEPAAAATAAKKVAAKKVAAKKVAAKKVAAKKIAVKKAAPAKALPVKKAAPAKKVAAKKAATSG